MLSVQRGAAVFVGVGSPASFNKGARAVLLAGSPTGQKLEERRRGARNYHLMVRLPIFSI